MDFRRWHALLLIGLMLALTPMALASPPDPSWVAGLWDDADFDDVILVITGSTGLVEPGPLVVTETALTVASVVTPTGDVLASALVPSSVQSRAPPTPR